MNNRIRTIIFMISALLLLAGAALYITTLPVAPHLFAVGASGIAICHFTVPVKDLDFRRRRLQMFNVFASILMLMASSLMFMERKEWVICLTIAALLQLYTAFVTPKDPKQT
ncbi:MAG: hypothetical protein LUG96_00905 [Tannerellaceae bacterium]|nr:hypothetical protein [Tannerellaceae bacterium]